MLMVNVKPVKVGKNTRLSFSRINEVMQMPNLIEVQKNSYRWFLDKGLKEVFRDIGDVSDYTGTLTLRFVDYRLKDEPKYSINECKRRGATYAIPLMVTARLFNKETQELKESEVFLGDFPKMTESGTFVINGAERVIISQLVRSPSVYFDMTHDKTGKELYTAQVIPNRGAWLEYETDPSDLCYVRIDKTRKIYITTFIKALGALTDEFTLNQNSDLLDFFGFDQRIKETADKDQTKNSEEAILEVYKRLRPGEPPALDSARDQLTSLLFDARHYDLSPVGRYKYNIKLSMASRLEGRTLSANEPVVSQYTGEVICDGGSFIDAALARKIESEGVQRVVLSVEGEDVVVFSNGMVDIHDHIKSYKVSDEELEEAGIVEKVRAKILFEILDEKPSGKKELLEVLSERCDELIPKHVIIDDILASVNYLNNVATGVGNTDDIDHLGNRRIRRVGELLQNQMRIGFARMERVIRERMSLQIQEPDKVTPAGLINIRPVTAAIREFFGSSPLSQFMDQTNPLSELTHKRRLSALGPGGLSRDRAGFEVRDVHYSHYGRMCPIETPEGPNIGLISYLATFSQINKYGFIEAPFRLIDKKTGVVKNTVEYMTADVEDDFYVVQANEPLDEKGRFLHKKVNARFRDQFVEIDASEADYMDVSPKMVVSVATGMIPFLEHDDANRALMGSNMQKQAVPLLTTESPIVATGMEYKAAVDSGAVLVAENSGKVSKVDASRIEITKKDGGVDTYELTKFLRSNQGTCVNQHPIVKLKQKVKAGDVIADGPATKDGEISLGKNALIGFMTWEGYNYEDAVLISENLVKNDTYTSIHIEEYECEARETKLGNENMTNDIPNVGEEALQNLDEDGVVRVGTEVHSGDILVGKVTPKGETELDAEEKLLHAIFSDKAKDVRDTSLRVPHGSYGIVVATETFTRKNSDELSPGVEKKVCCYIAQKRKIMVGDKMSGRHGNKGVVSRILPAEDMPFLEDGTPLDILLNPLGVPSRMNLGQVLEVHLGFAMRKLGQKIMTPVFDGAEEKDIAEALTEAGYRTDGKTILTDGRTGEKFENPITVGVMYFLKLHHLVDDKIHARSTGPYSLVTQQPLGGKAQFGGQRFGEMEVWALEAYGAAYTLQEILTVKSDDVVGRVSAYEAITGGRNIPKPYVPESFKVLVKELQALALDIRVLDDDGYEVELKQNLDDGNIPDYREAEQDMGPVVNDATESDGYIGADDITTETEIEDL